jgi:hypothetical protein
MITFFYIGCKGPEKETDVTEAPPEVTEEEHDAAKIADKLWEKMQTQNYRNNWKMWPGKGSFYPGTEPHGTLLTTYMNEPAYNAIANKMEQMPYGSIITKENYTENRSLSDITVMQKIEGFNPDANDWFWARYSPGGEIIIQEKYGRTVKLAGKVDGCIDCHSKQISNDYIFTSPLSEEIQETRESKSEEEIP